MADPWPSAGPAGASVSLMRKGNRWPADPADYPSVFRTAARGTYWRSSWWPTWSSEWLPKRRVEQKKKSFTPHRQRGNLDISLTFNLRRALNFLRQSTVSCLCTTEATRSRCCKHPNEKKFSNFFKKRIRVT